MRVKQGKWLLLAAAVLVFLFISSAMTYHEQTQVPLLERLLVNEPGRQLLDGIVIHYGDGQVVSVANIGYFKFVEFLMRKLAHFGSYFILGFALYMGLAPYVPGMMVRLWTVPLISGGFAALDEWHQAFTGDRSPMVQDVILDMTGALTAVLIVFCWQWLHARRRRR